MGAGVAEEPGAVPKAVEGCPDVLRFVPESLRTGALCAEAVLGSLRLDGIAELVPASAWTEPLAYAAVWAGGRSLGNVPEEMKTLDLCRDAVLDDGSALRFVPEALRTPALCLEAVKRDGVAFSAVPEALQTQELALEAAKSGLRPSGLPERFRTEDVWIEASGGWRSSLRSCGPRSSSARPVAMSKPWPSFPKRTGLRKCAWPPSGRVAGPSGTFPGT